MEQINPQIPESETKGAVRSVTAHELSQVFIPEELQVVHDEHPELLQAVRVAGGYALVLRRRDES